MRRARFETEIGTISTVDRNGAFSALHAQLLTIFQAEKVIGKMLYPDPAQREHLMATSALSTISWIAHSGIDQFGAPFATITLEQAAGGLGAFASRDGIDQGGTSFFPKSEVPDVEAWERHYPVLYLYRRSARNCGHGKYRGGNGIAFALTGHGTSAQTYSTISVTSSTPTTAGVAGGYHGAHGIFYSVRVADLPERFARGELPAGPEEVRALGDGRDLPAKADGLPLCAGDVIDQVICGSGGYGDPLERDAAAVARDLAEGQVSARIALAVYGVVVDGSGCPDDLETTRERDRLRAERLQRAGAPPRVDAGDRAGRVRLAEIADQLVVEQTAPGALVTCCRRCGAALGPADENYKLQAARYDGQLTEIDPVSFVDPASELDGDVVYRTYLCPGCGVLLDHELTLRSDPPVWDMQVDVAAWSC
jgi:N-methylhydantoinase B